MSKACCDNTSDTPGSDNHYNIGLLGNPNCGKSTLFNQLTGSRQHIGNWPGVTVDRKVGQFSHADTGFDIVDLPGVYSLDNSARSLDERITRDYILSSEPDVIINVVDASNLERNLYLSGQLLEMQVPMVVVVNMMDVAETYHLKVHIEALSSAMGCRVVPLVATTGEGLAALKQAVLETAADKLPPRTALAYNETIEAAIHTLLRTELRQSIGTRADDIPILYGGSVNPANAVRWTSVWST